MERHTTDTLYPTCAAIVRYVHPVSRKTKMRPRTMAELRRQVQDAWDNLSQGMTFGIFITVCMREFTPALLPEGATLSIDVTVWAHLTVTFTFHLV